MNKITAMFLTLSVLGMIGMASAQIGATVSVQAPTCAIGITSYTVAFPMLYSGETVAPDVSTGITVTNESTFVAGVGSNPSLGISTGLTVSGTNWIGTAISASDTMPVGQTSVLLGAYNGYNPYTSEFALTSGMSGDLIDLAPTASGGSAQILFGMSIPTGTPVDTYAQSITISTTC